MPACLIAMQVKITCMWFFAFLGRNQVPYLWKNENLNELRVSEGSLLVDIIKA